MVGPDLAEDIAQETFVAAWRSLDRLRDPDLFGAWIHRIAVNQCQTSLRRRHGVRDISIDMQQLEAAAPGRFELLAELRAVLLPALVRLSTDHRTVLSLHYAADLPISEVARVLEIPIGTAKSRLNAALRQVRRDLGEHDDA